MPYSHAFENMILYFSAAKVNIFFKVDKYIHYYFWPVEIGILSYCVGFCSEDRPKCSPESFRDVLGKITI
jgi:hypothetical protein